MSAFDIFGSDLPDACFEGPFEEPRIGDGPRDFDLGESSSRGGALSSRALADGLQPAVGVSASVSLAM